MAKNAETMGMVKTMMAKTLKAVAVSAAVAALMAACLCLGACGGDMLATTEQARDGAQESSAAVAAAGQQDAADAAAETGEVAQNEVAVVIDTANAAAYNDKFPKSLGSFTVSFEEGDTAYDALEKTGVKFESRGRSYVSSIGGVGEKACGPNSGWLYLVDGEQPTTTASDYQLHGGETVLWAYTVTEGDVEGSTAMNTKPAGESAADTEKAAA